MRAGILVIAAAACGDSATIRDAAPPDAAPDRVLVFTRTLGYRHADSIDEVNRVLPARFADAGILVDITEDPAQFSTDNLARYGAVFFFYTSGNDVLDADGKAALEAFVRGGGAWFGLHSAADTEYTWPFYQQLVVTPFRTHPGIQPATVHVEAVTHPAMAGAPSPWQATDEWYDFVGNARDVAGTTVLATLDESTYTGGSTGADHPLIWCHERLGGRAVYSAIGHVAARWSEPAFLTHIDSVAGWLLRRD
jgi:type 1 glutamine amidotransferase